ncbi:phosphoserine aminotransferase-like [Paramacrobiotus metropolitanus]|uniref:phosphoserine aminotransferase-like n=1 Tax=Paramacrobiotus metropolitanus TaxID=2943436 RepID=UPI0024460B98|nr:phosphoserine aminotransferase-like [Paramacrobiotus metropolitanus]
MESVVNGCIKKKIINFSPGPAKIPEEVLEIAQKELVDFQGHGLSVMEMSHRSKEFESIIFGAEKTVRELLDVPANYKVLFMQGGGAGQFSAVPLNLMRTGTADYLVSGSWSQAAAKEAKKYGTVHLVAPTPEKFGSVPDESEWKFSDNSSYFYHCGNETVHGVELPTTFTSVPGHLPIVADISSSLMSRKFDVSKYGMVFGGAQKNVGCAGVVLGIIREDLFGHARKECPSVLDYKLLDAHTSLYNTPPCFNVYVMGLVLNWIKKHGGLDAMDEMSQRKSSLIYSVIDKSNGFYYNPVDKRYRSRMNVPFRVGGVNGDEELEKRFLQEAGKLHMVQLKGHRSVGGMRASLYNAVTVEETQVLADFMQDFYDRNRV